LFAAVDAIDYDKNDGALKTRNVAQFKDDNA
jgi:hypothetical protein